MKTGAQSFAGSATIPPDATNTQPVQLRLNAGKIALSLSALTFLLLAAHIWTLILLAGPSGQSAAMGRMDHFFNFNNENNLPSFFSSLLLLMAAGLLYLIGKISGRKDPHQGKWLLLSVIIVFVALDEAIQIHERVNTITQRYFANDWDGYLRWTWIIPYSLVFGAAILYFLRFYLSLPSKTRINFFIAAFLFCLGAVLIESIEGHFNKLYDNDHVIFKVTTTLQELLEMVGVIVFIYGLTRYLSGRFNQVELVRK